MEVKRSLSALFNFVFFLCYTALLAGGVLAILNYFNILALNTFSQYYIEQYLNLLSSAYTGIGIGNDFILILSYGLPVIFMILLWFSALAIMLKSINGHSCKGSAGFSVFLNLILLGIYIYAVVLLLGKSVTLDTILTNTVFFGSVILAFLAIIFDIMASTLKDKDDEPTIIYMPQPNYNPNGNNGNNNSGNNTGNAGDGSAPKLEPKKEDTPPKEDTSLLV